MHFHCRSDEGLLGYGLTVSQSERQTYEKNIDIYIYRKRFHW